MSGSSANEIIQSWLIDGIAFVEIDRARFFRVQAGVEEVVGIFQGSALKKVQLDGLLIIRGYALAVNRDKPSSTAFLLRFPARSAASLFCCRRW